MLIKKNKDNIPPRFVKITIEVSKGYSSFYIIDDDVIINGYWDGSHLKRAQIRIIDNLSIITDLNNYLNIRRLTLETDERKIIISELELTHHPQQRYSGEHYVFTIFGQTEVLKWES